ncbi:MAG: endo alpha-1,4 polygalactosaminidase [Campylobacterales bacterium]|nr:endo alpha-1,4 polygalactosaminidase [Campylobacterales bacterium]
MRKLVILFILFLKVVMGDERYAFIYSKNIDDRFINFYDKVIVEADAIDNIYALRYPDKMVAYVSVGEIEPWRKTETPYQESWIISENKTWNSLIADLRQEAYQAFILQRVAKLYQQGYRNFFLDTMDAYHVTAKDKALFQTQQKALVSFIHTLHLRYPDVKLIVNRAFEIIDQIHSDIDAVVAESLIAGYDHAQKAYITVSDSDREWLLNQFKKAQQFGLDAIAIEYSDQGTQKRLKIAQAVKKLGIIPYVTDGLLQEQGECNVKRIRRDILILYNQSIFKDRNPVYSDVHLMASMPLEYYGYVPILYDIADQELPSGVEDRYHAVIVWSNGKTQNDQRLFDWTQRLIKRGIKVLFVNSFSFNPTAERLKTLGITETANENPWTTKSQAAYRKPYGAYEIEASIEYEPNLIQLQAGDPVLTINYPNGQSSTPIAVTPWGGYALHNALTHSLGDENLWTIDPFRFLKTALRLESIPVPDPTTEAGRRILLAHVDGDGFMESVQFEPEKLSVEYLMEHIYKRYPIPHTLSIIQGEVDSSGLYPELSERMKRVARELYRLPWVEPASHTLSHPFFWNETKQGETETYYHNHLREGKLYHLPLQNYTFSLEKETKKSVDFALSLAPETKRSKQILFWSGDCLPNKETLAYIERQGIIALNGGDTTAKTRTPWLNRIAPFGVQHDAYWQVYTGQQNENVYTNNWLGPFWGYRNAISTFEMTGEPKRLKPIDIYYHFYSGSKLASFNALIDVYEWAMQQNTAKLYASQYIDKVTDFYRTALGKTDEGYEIRNSGDLKTVRVDNPVYVDIRRSQGVAGYRHHQESTYITLDSGKEQRLVISDHQPDLPYLIESNGWVKATQHTPTRYRFELESNMPLEARFHLPTGCHLITDNTLKTSQTKQSLTIQTVNQQGVNVVFECQ